MWCALFGNRAPPLMFSVLDDLIHYGIVCIKHQDVDTKGHGETELVRVENNHSSSVDHFLILGENLEEGVAHYKVN